MARTKNFQIEKKWVFLDNKKPNFESKKISSEMISILSSRGIQTEKEALEFLNPKYESLTDPFKLADMEKAVKIILDAVSKKKRITIYGDYDVDGITSTALLIRFFEEIGINVGFYIPSRQDEGYGLNEKAIAEIAESGTELIITVDCGSTSVDEIKKAKELGLTVIITDHHSLKMDKEKDILPAADAIINPRRSDSGFKQELAGVGVAFYLVRALQSKIGNKLGEGQEKWLLDLVALGTICDVVPLKEDNRILVKYGLKVLAKTKQAGLKALAKVANVEIENIDSYKVGFLMGPRLNAAGRLEHANMALNLLLTKDPNEAEKLAIQLNDLNIKRQEVTERILNEAKEKIGKIQRKQNIYLLSDKNWPSGVVGIVASRLVEEFGRPVLIMEETDGEFKGSARSISGFNIISALTKCSDFLGHFGGHAYAAGFKLKKEHFILLEEKLIEITNKDISEEDLIPEVIIDKKVTNKDIAQRLMNDVNLLEPFGSQNFPPVFAVLFQQVIESRLVGNPPLHLKLTLKDDTGFLSGIAFNYGEYCVETGNNADVAFYINENTWNGQTKVEARFIDIKLNK